MPKPSNPTFRSWQRRFKSYLMRLALYGAMPTARFVVTSLAIIIVAYLLYQHVWQPLVRAVEVPVGVSPTNPALDTEQLQAISTARAARVQAPRHNFIRYNSLFAPRRN